MSMELGVVDSSWHRLDCDAVVLILYREEASGRLNRSADECLDGLLAELTASGEWTGANGDILVIHRPADVSARRLVLLGAGRRGDGDGARLRDRMVQVVRKFRGSDVERIAVAGWEASDSALSIQAGAEGLVIGSYGPDEYKTRDRSRTKIGQALFCSADPALTTELQDALNRGKVLGEATNLARSLVNQPGNRINPVRLAEEARSIAEKSGLQIEILDEPAMENEGMGALLAVARGSDEPARMIVLKHFGAEDDGAPPVVLIGKGVTFDSGGLSLKTSQGMEEMKADKAGACAVLAAMQAVSRLRLRKNVVGILPAVENMPGGRAQRPGDVVRSMSGKTIEVLNTDAEGRLILADAMHYARRLNPACMVDIATLTGACVIALGHVRAGLFSNHDRLAERFFEASERAGEKFWRLPLDDEYRSLLDSHVADIKNVGKRAAGAVTAAKFLQEFVGDTPWCHIDIAGVDMFQEGGANQGPTGFGVRTMVELASLYPDS